MLPVLKLCNLRKCSNHNFPLPIEVFNPCKVYVNTNDGNWYDETTSRTIKKIEHNGVVFDAESWLNTEYLEALRNFRRGKKVHEELSENIKGPPKKKHAKTTEIDGSSCDKLVQEVINERIQVDRLSKEIKEKKLEMNAYIKIGERIGRHSSITQKTSKIKEEIKKLEEERRRINIELTPKLGLFKEENDWVNRWCYKPGFTTKEILVARNRYHTYKIINGCLFIDRYNNVFEGTTKEAIQFAKEKFGIKEKWWTTSEVLDDRIGLPIRRFGKKNTHSARIRSRKEQIEYEQEVIKLASYLYRSGAFDKITKDKSLESLYTQKIKPKISKRPPRGEAR